jgi:hypothetical protein
VGITVNYGDSALNPRTAESGRPALVAGCFASIMDAMALGPGRGSLR